MRFKLLASFGTIALMGLASMASAGDLIISEVVDGSRTGGLPKWVEITNTSSNPIELSNYSIANANNGSTTLGGGASTSLPSGTLAAGASYVIAYEADPFATYVDTYGSAPDFGAGGAFINGDDVILLFEGTAVSADYPYTNVVDSYGELGLDGTGLAWEYMDGWARRLPGANQARGLAFDVADWTISGINVLDGIDDAEAKAKLLAQTNPGTHTFDGKGVPGAPTWVLSLIATMLAASAFFVIRRKANQAA